MKFLNKKEQVIDLEITPYGKSLLSMGRFSPEYYAFFDDGILYDSQYGGILEHQNSASVRIKEIPQLETQTYFYSAEKQVKEATAFHQLSQAEKLRAKAFGSEPMDITGQPYVQDDSVTIGTIPDREFNKEPVGNSKLNSSYAPAWDINIMEGFISSSTQTMAGLDLPIPQLNLSASMFGFSLSTASVGNNFYEFDEEGNLHPDNKLKSLFLNVLGDSIAVEISETNTEFMWENFEVEIFKVEEVKFLKAQPIGLPACSGLSCDRVTKEFLTPLFFRKPINYVRNGILLDPDEIAIDSPAITPKYAEYFFDIIIDDGVSRDIICKKAINKAEGLYSQRTTSCDERDKKQKFENIDKLYIREDDGLGGTEDCD